MTEVETQAESSPAETADVFNGQTPSLSEYNAYRASGEVPERFKPAEKAEPATADTPKKTEPSEVEETETAPESDPETTQEHPPKGSSAEKRIKQLLAQKKDLERKLAEAAKPAAITESAPAQAPAAPPQNYQEYRKQFKPAEWIEGFAKANPQATYEDATAAMADHLADAREHYRKIDERVSKQHEALNAMVEEAKERYEDFDEIKDAFLGSVLGEKGPTVPANVLEVINDSDVLPDLIYTLGSDEKELADFVKLAKAHPTQAIRYIARLEAGIEEELAKGEAEEEPTGKAPERQRTAAPPPPSPVTGGSGRSFDASDESLSADEWMRKRNAQLSRKA